MAQNYDFEGNFKNISITYFLMAKPTNLSKSNVDKSTVMTVPYKF